MANQHYHCTMGACREMIRTVLLWCGSPNLLSALGSDIPHNAQLSTWKGPQTAVSWKSLTPRHSEVTQCDQIMSYTTHIMSPLWSQAGIWVNTGRHIGLGCQSPVLAGLYKIRPSNPPPPRDCTAFVDTTVCQSESQAEQPVAGSSLWGVAGEGRLWDMQMKKELSPTPHGWKKCQSSTDQQWKISFYAWKTLLNLPKSRFEKNSNEYLLLVFNASFHFEIHLRLYWMKKGKAHPMNRLQVEVSKFWQTAKHREEASVE